MKDTSTGPTKVETRIFSPLQRTSELHSMPCIYRQPKPIDLKEGGFRISVACSKA